MSSGGLPELPKRRRLPFGQLEARMAQEGSTVADSESPAPAPASTKPAEPEAAAKKDSPDKEKPACKLNMEDLWAHLEASPAVLSDEKQLYYVRSYVTALIPKLIQKSEVR